MSDSNLHTVIQSNLSPETLSQIKSNPETATSGFVESNPFPGQDLYDNLTNQPFNSQPLQDQVPSIPDTPGVPKSVNLNAWAQKQNDNIFNKLGQVNSWGADDYGDLKPYTFGTGAKHTNFDRYYHHPKFEELGFTPFRDNEALYNENSTVMDDFIRSASQWDNIFASTMVSSYRSLGDIFTGDFFEPDIESAYELETAMNIGYSSRGGIMGGFNNLFLQSSIPVAMGVDFLVTEAALAMTGNIPGMGLKAAQTGVSIGRMSKLLANMPKLRNFYNGAKQVGRSTTAFALPNTVKNLAEYGQGTNKLLNFANTVGTFGEFFKDVRNMNYALSESKLEGGLVKNQLANDLIFEHIDKFGENPDDKTMAEIYDTAQDAGFTTTAINFPIIFATNKIVFDNLFKGPKIGARSSIEVIDAGLRNGKKLVYDAAKASTGQAFKEVGLLGATKASIKSLARPSTYLRNGLSYFKGNLSEGLQEVTQEIVSGATYDYYKQLYEDPAMGGIEQVKGATLSNIKKQMSSEGFEVFASGFFMGGLMNVMGAGVNAVKAGTSTAFNEYYKRKNPEAYKNDYENNKKKNQEIIDSLNKLYEDPMQFFSPDKENLIENLRLNNGLAAARNNGDEKEFMDFSDVSKFNGIYNALSLNRYDSLLDMLKDMRQLEGSELKQALKLEDNVSNEEAQALLDKAINRAEKIKSNYDSLSKYQNPFNPERFRKADINKNPDIKEQYTTEALAYLGFEAAKKKAVFSVHGFERAKERMQSISDGLSQNPAVEKTTFTDILPLLSSESLDQEINNLEAEIVSLEEATDDYNKKLKKNKESKLKALKAIKENSPRFSDKEEGQLDIFKDEMAKKLYEDYFKTIADINNTFYNEEKVKDAVKAISDYYNLEQDANKFSNDVNTIFNPNGFYQLVAQETKVRKALYEKRQELIKNAIEKFEKVKGDNEFLNLLYDANIAINPDNLEQLMLLGEDNIPLLIETIDNIEFIDTTTNDVFTKKETEKFKKVQEVIDDWKARREEGDDTTTKEEETDTTKEELTPEEELKIKEGVDLPVIKTQADFNKLPKPLRDRLASANAQFNSEMQNEGEKITRPYQFANMPRGKKILSEFFNNPENAAAVKEYNDKIKAGTKKPTTKKEETTTSVPLTITSQVRQQLYDLGYSKEDVDAMKPETAQDIIANQTTKPKKAPVQPSTIEAKRADIERRRQEELGKKESRSFTDEGGVTTTVTITEYQDKKVVRVSVEKDGEKGGQYANTYPKELSNDKIYKAENVDEYIYTDVKNIKVEGKRADKINAKYDAELAALEGTDTETTVDETIVDDYTIQSEDQLREYAELDQAYEGELAAFKEGQFGSSVEYRIANKLGNFKVRKQDFIKYSDKANLEGKEGKKISRQYTRKDETDILPIDLLAMEASDEDVEVTIQDIIDFILKYPAGVGSVNSKSTESFYGYHNPKLDPKYKDIKEIKNAVKEYYDSKVKTIRPELMGKIVYVTPGSGKTASSNLSDDVIDGDDLLYEEVRSLPEYTDISKKELPAILGIISSDPETADRIYNNAMTEARKLANEGKTVLFGSRRLIPEVDVVITSLASEENNERIINNFVSLGQNVEGARRSLINIRNTENKVKNKTVINVPFDTYIFGDIKTLPKSEIKSFDKIKKDLAEARTFDDVRAIETNFIAQGLISNLEQAKEFNKLVKEKKRDLKENLNFENVKVGDILLLKDKSKNTIVKQVTSDYIVAFKPDGRMVTINKEDFNNQVEMIYNSQAENDDEKIIGGKTVTTPTNEEIEVINDNLEDYSSFTQNKEVIAESSREADEQSAEEIDNEFLDDLGCK